MQRPLRSQSPKRVGSGPVGPPNSAACVVEASSETGRAGESDGLTEGTAEPADAGRPTPWGSFCIEAEFCQNRCISATGKRHVYDARHTDARRTFDRLRRARGARPRRA